MSEELLINVTPQEIRVALVDNGVLQELQVERSGHRGLVGNIYKGIVEESREGVYIRAADSSRVLVSQEKAESLKRRGYVGREVYFGVRPENFHDADCDPLSDAFSDAESVVER